MVMGVVEWRVAAWLLLLGVLAVGVGATPSEGRIRKGREVASEDGDTDQSHKELVGEATEKTQHIEDARQKEKLFFFGSYRTMTHIIVTYDTTTVPLFCLSGTATVPCPAGRRKRQVFPITFKEEQFASDIIDGSQNQESAADPLPGDLEDGGKKFFTIWTKVLTTTTLTSTTTNTASTVTLSYYCTAGSLSIPPLCG